MQIVLNASEMALVDRTTIEDIGIPGIVLMENAGLGIVREIEKLLGTINNKHVLIVCGKGNNGGDGYVIARHLFNRGCTISVLLAGKKEALKGDALINCTILEKMNIEVIEIASLEEIPNSPKTDLIVDALLGTGVTGPVKGFFADLIEYMNNLNAPILSVDLPSGMETDTGAVHGNCVHALMTVTMAHLKTGLLFSPARDYAGKITVVDISVPPEISDRLKGDKFFIESHDVAQRLPIRKRDAHKTSCGKVAIISGSVGMTGAASLSAIASLKAGAGLTKLGIPASLNSILEQKLTEVMTIPLPETYSQSVSIKAKDKIRDLLNWADVLAIGPGLSTHKDTVAMVHWILKTEAKPLVLDADGINACAENPELIQQYKGPMIVTPHPGEFSRIIHQSVADISKNRLQILKNTVTRFGKTIILKGGPTIIGALDGNIYINSTGNPGMATGGSGDVLTGIIAGLWAQGLSETDAAICAVYLHGLAGDLAANDKTEISLTAEDLTDYLPSALKTLLG